MASSETCLQKVHTMPDGHWHHTVGCCTHGQIQEVVWQWLFLVKGHSTVSRVRVAQIVSPVFFVANRELQGRCIKML